MSDFQWEELFLSGLRKVNEGNQGAIFRVEEEYRDGFRGIRPIESSARRMGKGVIPLIKAEKIFSESAGKAEFGKQKQAFDITEASAVSDQVRVPVLWETGCHSVLIENTTRLQRRLGIIGAGVTFFAMEEVDGVDLATFAYQQAILEMLRQDIEEGYPHPMRVLLYSVLRQKLARSHLFDEIEDKGAQSHVMKLVGGIRSSMLGVSFDLARHWDENLGDEDKRLIESLCPMDAELTPLRGMRENPDLTLHDYVSAMTDIGLLEQTIVDLRPECTLAKSAEERRRQFMETTYRYVANRGLISRDLCEAVRLALETLHKDGYYHRDLHERNLMITRDRQTAYLIDFGKSNPNGDSSGRTHNYQAVDGVGLDDFGIVAAGSKQGKGGLLYLLSRERAS